MTAVEDAQDVVPVRRAVKFTPATPLVEGDIVRFEVTGAVRVVRSNPPEITVGFADVGINRAVTLGLHGAIVTGTLHRLLPPLPPEPPVGVEVLGVTRSGTLLVFERWGDRGWATNIDGPMPWAVLLARYGPLRLLGDPIEAPR